MSGQFRSAEPGPAPEDTTVRLRWLEALIDETERLAKLGHWEWDQREDRCLYCSRELARLFECSVVEYMAKANSTDGFLLLLHPQDRTSYKTAVDEAIKEGRGWEIEYRIIQSNGRMLDVREVSDVELDDDGELLRTFGFVQDLTEIKSAAAALRASEEALRRAQRQARIGNWRWNVPDNCLISCSEEYARIHGVKVEEAPALLAAQMERVVHPDDRGRVEAEFRRFDEEGIDYEIEYRIIRPDGEVRHVFEIGETLLDAHGVAVEQTGTIQDITERKRIEEALRRSHEELEDRVRRRTAQLRESEARYRQIFDTAAAGIGRASLVNGRLILSNHRLAQMFGYETVKEFVRDFVFLERAVEPTDFERLMTSYKETPGEAVTCNFITKLGMPIVIQAHATPNYEEGVLEFVATDITAQRATEERLRQAQKMEAVGQLTGGVAHDFNNLLAVIMGNVELLQLRVGFDDEELQAVYRAAKRGAELTQRLLAFSRQQPLAPQGVDLGALTQAMSALLRRALGETVQIEIEDAAGLWSAHADPGQVENALLNLALNARDAMPLGGKLKIACSNVRLDGRAATKPRRDDEQDIPAGDYVVLTVEDDGSGMPRSVRERALEPFFTTKEVGQGSGLGLSMVYGFAKQSGGHVTIDSTEGKGTTVRLFLPRTKVSAARPQPVSRPAVTKGNGERILVIEDDPEVGVTTVSMLTDLNYRADHVRSAQEARRILAQSDAFALVLCDLVLPGEISGAALAVEIQQAYPTLEVVLMSGHPADRAGDRPTADRGIPFLSKPFRRQTLAEVLARSLGR